MRGMGVANVLLVSGLLLFAGAAGAREISCDVDSDYDFHMTPRSVIFTRESGTPKAIVMREGRLFIDDQWATLSAADSRRIKDYERDARATMLIAQQIGHDAAEIAFITLGEVAAGFSSNPRETRAKLDKARAQLDARLARSVTPTRFNGRDLGQGIASAVGDVLPTLIGDIVGGAVSAALSGDTARLQRMEKMDKDIEARVEPRANALERRAETLCHRMEALDAIDDALEYRQPNGQRLELLEAKATRHE